MANYHSQQTLAAKYGLRVTMCDWRDGVYCVFHDCRKCGWHPEVEDQRKAKIRERMMENKTEKLRIGNGSK